MPAERTISQDFACARRLQDFFISEGLRPADTFTVVAAFNAVLLVLAQQAGKPATIDNYVELYRDALKVFYDVAKKHLEVTPNALAKDKT